MTSTHEELETAVKRNFVVAIDSKPGLNPAHSQVVVVKATSIKKARVEAIKKVAKGKFSRRRNEMFWVFKSIEEVPNE